MQFINITDKNLDPICYEESTVWSDMSQYCLKHADCIDVYYQHRMTLSLSGRSVKIIVCKFCSSSFKFFKKLLFKRCLRQITHISVENVSLSKCPVGIIIMPGVQGKVTITFLFSFKD